MQRYIWNPSNEQEYHLFYCEYYDQQTNRDKFFISWVRGMRGTSFVSNKDDVIKFNQFSHKLNIDDSHAMAIISFLNDIKKIDIDIELPYRSGEAYVYTLDCNGYKHKINLYG